MGNVTLKIKALNSCAQMPYYATEGAACIDFRAPLNPAARGDYVFPGKPLSFKLGLAVEVPEGYALLMFSRSGQGFNSDTRLANCVGVIDSDYRGELNVKLTCDGPNIMRVEPGDRVCQGMLVQVPRIVIEEVTELGETVRGEGGLGSTGV
jgi:dUTP pyrophosphatase